MKPIIALAIAAALAAPLGAAPASAQVQAQTQTRGLSQLERQIQTEIDRLGIEGVDVRTLTTGQLAAIKGTVESSGDMSKQRLAVRAIIAGSQW